MYEEKKKSLKNWVDVKENKRYKELYIGGKNLFIHHAEYRVGPCSLLTGINAYAYTTGLLDSF